MEIKVRIAILSHLSDAQELINMGFKDKAYNQITFESRLDPNQRDASLLRQPFAHESRLFQVITLPEYPTSHPSVVNIARYYAERSTRS